MTTDNQPDSAPATRTIVLHRPVTRTVLIAGAGSGLGRGLCGTLAKSNFELVAMDPDRLAASKTMDQVLADGGKCRSLVLDADDPGAAGAALERVGDHGVQVLITIPRLELAGSFEELPAAPWDQVVGDAVREVTRLVRIVLPGMRKRRFGRIITIGSALAAATVPRTSAGIVAAHALVGFTRALALETADTDITVNLIGTSYLRIPAIETRIQDLARTRVISEEVARNQLLAPMPKGVLVTVEEVAAMVEFLISDQARNVTGQTLFIDGGWTVV